MNNAAKEYEHKSQWHSQHRYADQIVTTKDGKIVGAIYLYQPYDPRVEELEKILLEINRPVSFSEATEYDPTDIENIRLPDSTGGD